MPIHLYCLLPGGNEPPRELGIRSIGSSGFAAWVSDTDQPRVSREARKAAANVLEHDRVIARALAQSITPVPATLADPYPDDAALLRDVKSRRDEISASLGRVEGMVEMAVIIAGSPSHDLSHPPSPTTGRAYLEQRRDLPAALAAAGDEIDRRLGPLVIASVRRAGPDRLGLSHLVRRTDVAAYREAVLGAASGHLRLVVDGPRAPYSFAAFAPKIEVP